MTIPIEEKTETDINVNSFTRHIEAYISRKINNYSVPTGFKQIDQAINGGLHEGLIIVGAQSSLGKTSLALQIANNAAQAGHCVIFFSLEQSISELIQKSISLRSRGNLTQFEVRQLSSNQLSADDPLFDHYQPAVNAVFEYSDNLFVIETARTVSAIAEETFKIIETTGKPALVVIDYLQIIQPDQLDQSREKRNNIDFNVTSLKLLSKKHQIPVLAISSMNRGSYGSDTGQAAFKESGGIEYSADLLLGLQYQAAEGGKDYDLAAEADKSPREVQVKILKQRDGMAGKRINLKYYAAHNCFEELPELPKSRR